MNEYLSAALKRFARMYIAPSPHNTAWETWVRNEIRNELDLMGLVEDAHACLALRKRAFLALIAPDVRLLPFYWEYVPEHGHYVRISPALTRFMRRMGNSSLLHYGAANLVRYFTWTKKHRGAHREAYLAYNDLACLFLVKLPYVSPEATHLADLIEPWDYSALECEADSRLIIDVVLQEDICETLRLRIDKVMRTALQSRQNITFGHAHYAELLSRYAASVGKFISTVCLEPTVMSHTTKTLIKEQLAFLAATNRNEVRCLTQTQSSALAKLELIDCRMSRILALPHSRTPVT